VSGSGSGSGGRPLTVVYYAPEYHSNDGSLIQARAVFAHLAATGSDNAELDLLIADNYFTYVRKWNGILAELGLCVALAVIDAAHVAVGVASSPRARPAPCRAAIHLGRRPRHPSQGRHAVKSTASAGDGGTA